jgi:mRNA degradation ribonuclease J1/J2
MTIDKRTGKLTQQPDIISRGFIYMKGSEDLLKEVKHEVRKVVETKSKTPNEPNWAFIRSEVRDCHRRVPVPKNRTPPNDPTSTSSEVLFEVR